MDGSWKFREAWRVLKAQLLETRRIAAEGVEAIRAEATLYFAAVGPPGLIPIQYVVDKLMPFSIATALRQSFVDALRDVKNPNIRSLQLKEFTVGDKAPEFLAFRVYDLKQDAMAFDVDTKWVSDLEAKLIMVTKRIQLRVPVTVRKVRFEGTIRIILTPLTAEPPGYGAILVSFPSVPDINLDVNVAGSEITRVPWLRTELVKELQKTIETQFLWPQRLVIPEGKLLSKKTLEELAKTDPLLEAEERLMEERPMLKEEIEKRKPTKQKLKDFLNVLVKGD